MTIQAAEQTRERKTFSEQDVQTMKDALKTAPIPKRSMSKQEALHRIALDLKNAHESGHTFASLVEELGRQGLHTHVRAVSQTIARLGASSSKKIRVKKRLKMLPLPDKI